MFGLELWFVLALLSTISGGVASFIYKVASVHRQNATLLASYSGMVSGLLMTAFFIFNGDFQNLWHPMLILAFLAAATFFFTQLIKVEALKHIDTAIFFPLYKVAGPMVAIVLGLIFFGEKFDLIEWAGLILSLSVPILLLTKAEHIRQNDLIKGIWLVLLCSALAAVSIAFTKEGTDVTLNVWGFIVAGEMFMLLTGILLLVGRYNHRVLSVVKEETNKGLIAMAIILGSMHALGAYTMVFAFHHQGPLAIVYTINSLYILIPIILSIIFYHEHWNARKVIAIVLSIAALGLLR